MRICIRKLDKRLIEMQSSATEGTLIQNAINGGYATDEIEEREVDEAGYEAAKAKDPVEIAAKQAAIDKAAVQAAKAKSLIDNLPSWAAVEAAIDGATTLAAMKVIFKKVCRVVYWDVKNTAT